MTIVVEKNVPGPTSARHKNDEHLPFEKLEVGDSFVVALNGRKSWAFLFSKIQYAQNTRGIKLTTRCENGDATKRRVWRVE